MCGVFTLALCLTCWGPAIAQDVERGLTVTGEGLVEVETAIATIRLGVSITGDSASNVQQLVAEQMDELVNKLRELEVSNLQTTGISLFPVYSNRENTRLNEVRGTNTVQFEVPVEQAGNTLDSAALAGASQVESVTFRPTDDDALAGRNEALRLAVEDALGQADVVLKALNLEQQTIHSIQVNSSSYSPEPFEYERSLSSSVAPPTPVIGGANTISATVTLTVQY